MGTGKLDVIRKCRSLHK